MTENNASDQPTFRRPRKLLLIPIIGLVAVALVGTANLVVGGRVEAKVGDQLECRLPDGASLKGVDLDGSSLLAVTSGTADAVTVEVTGYPVNDVPVDATAELTDLALGDDVPDDERVGSVDVSVEADAAALDSLMSARADDGEEAPEAELAIVDGALTASLGAAGMPATVVLEPTVSGDSLRLTPVSVQVGQRSFAPEVLQGLAGGLVPEGGADPLAPRDIDIPGLPEGSQLVSAEVAGDRLVLGLELSGDAVAARLADQQTPSCA